MNGQWNEVARLHFKGERFRDHALDLSAVTELRQFQKMIAETARALWRSAHPEHERMPAHFEDRTRLCLRRIEEGSATVPLEIFAETPLQGELWEPVPEEVDEAVELAFQVFDSVVEDRPLPDRFPKQLISEYAEWGKALGPDEYIELKTPTRERVTRLDAGSRARLAAYGESPHSTMLEVIGKVLEADVRQRRFQVWTNPKTALSVEFDESQEVTVTRALMDHRSICIRIRGTADISPQGKPIRFTDVTMLELTPAGGVDYDPGAPRIEDEIAEIAAGVSAAAWERLPKDLNDQLDHYLYGAPRQ